jgi:hypothetical protein
MAIIKKLTTFTDKLKRIGNMDAKQAAKSSAEWFKTALSDRLGNENRWATKFMKGSDRKMRKAINTENFPMIGHLYHYVYDPKTKNEMPYYDIFPLVVPMNYTSNGFLGLNFHYLPPVLRAQLFDSLLSLKAYTQYRGGEQEYMNLSYKVLKGMGNTPYKPTIKRYLWSHVKSNFAHIDSDEWENVVFLPSEQFKKAGKREVWADSRRNT